MGCQYCLRDDVVSECVACHGSFCREHVKPFSHACPSIVGRFDNIPTYKPKKRPRRRMPRLPSRGAASATTIAICLVLIAGILVQGGYAAQLGSFISSWSLSDLRSSLSPPPINAAWVRQFFGNISSVRESKGEVAYQHNPEMDSVAMQRFNVMVPNYQISHYGFQQDPFGEEVLFPDGFSPSGYLADLASFAPIHYNGLMDKGVSQYGFYIGSGPTYLLNQGCGAREIPGPDINESQFFEAHGCTYTVENGTWLVLELG